MAWDITLNIIVGFLVPWIFGVILYLKDKKTIFLFAPFAALKSYTLNELGFHLNFWRYIPVYLKDDLTTVSTNLGFFLILSCYLIYFIQKKAINPYILILLFAIGTSALEYFALLTGLIAYGNGWNIGWSFLAYLIPYLLDYWYFLQLKRLRAFD